MIKISKEEFIELKGKDIVPVICDHCSAEYFKPKRQIMDCKRLMQGRDVRMWKWNSGVRDYCTKKCAVDSLKRRVECVCTNCNSSFTRRQAASQRPKHLFCSRSCSATYNNTHKTRGINISKLEVWLQQKLQIIYPNTDIHYNRKDAIDSELDIFIPTLNLAFEINGIFHYEPVYGEERLKKSINNDEKKMQACLERGIELCVINTTS